MPNRVIRDQYGERPISAVQLPNGSWRRTDSRCEPLEKQLESGYCAKHGATLVTPVYFCPSGHSRAYVRLACGTVRRMYWNSRRWRIA